MKKNDLFLFIIFFIIKSTILLCFDNTNFVNVNYDVHVHLRYLGCLALCYHP